MVCDLRRILGPLQATLPKTIEGKHVFSQSSFSSSLPEVLASDQLIVTKTTRAYDGFRADRLCFHATKQTYQELGLLILAVIFKQGGYRTARLDLTQSGSTVKRLILHYEGYTRRWSGHETTPHRFVFCPEAVHRHPWSMCNLDLLSLPRFTLTNEKSFLVTEADWTSRDTVSGFGNDDANVALASLLLNIGYAPPRDVEFALEGEGGFRGVGVHSAEATFWCYDKIEDAIDMGLVGRIDLGGSS